MVATPDGRYEVPSGASYSAALVSGIGALMLERKADLTPGQDARHPAAPTLKDVGPTGRDPDIRASLRVKTSALLALRRQSRHLCGSAPPFIGAE